MILYSAYEAFGSILYQTIRANQPNVNLWEAGLFQFALILEGCNQVVSQFVSSNAVVYSDLFFSACCFQRAIGA